MQIIKKIVTNLIRTIGVLAIFLIGCSLYRDNASPRATTETQQEALTYGKACSISSKCLPAYIFSGKINDYSASIVEANLIDITKVGMLCFHSAGGEGGAMLKIARLVQEHNIPTCLADKYITNKGEIYSSIEIEGQNINSAICASACGFILLSSEKRVYIGRTPLIGVHSPFTALDLCFCSLSLPFSIIDDTGDIEQIIMHIPNKERRDIANAYHKLSLETKSSSMHFLTDEEIERYMIFTKTIN